MAFDQAIWYLKIILPEDTVWWIYLCNCNLATTFFRFWRVVSADLTKRLKELYSADGQIVIPLEGLAISQPGNQLGYEHTKLHERYILSHRHAEESFMAVNFQGWNLQGSTDWRSAPGNLEPFFSSFFFYICPPPLHFLPSLSEKIKIQAFEKLQIKWNTFWTFIFKWAAAAASVASDRFGAKLIIPHKKALLSVLTQGWFAG